MFKFFKNLKKHKLQNQRIKNKILERIKKNNPSIKLFNMNGSKLYDIVFYINNFPMHDEISGKFIENLKIPVLACKYYCYAEYWKSYYKFNKNGKLIYEEREYEPEYLGIPSKLI